MYIYIYICLYHDCVICGRLVIYNDFGSRWQPFYAGKRVELSIWYWYKGWITINKFLKSVWVLNSSRQRDLYMRWTKLGHHRFRLWLVTFWGWGEDITWASDGLSSIRHIETRFNSELKITFKTVERVVSGIKKTNPRFYFHDICPRSVSCWE